LLNSYQTFATFEFITKSQTQTQGNLKGFEKACVKIKNRIIFGQH